MARIRSVKPEFWTDGDMLKLSRDTRLFYIGLWNFADDNGVVESDPLSLKARIFPCDEVDVSKCITELQSVQKVIVYKNGDKKEWLMIKSFLNHQLVDRPRKSNNPLPPKEQLESLGFQLKSYEISLGEERKGEERKGKDTASLFNFDVIWEGYPLKLGRKDALRHFNATVLTEQDYELIKKALYNYCHSEQVKNPKFIKHGSTWFNEWHDWIAQVPKPTDPLEKWIKKENKYGR